MTQLVVKVTAPNGNVTYYDLASGRVGVSTAGVVTFFPGTTGGTAIPGQVELGLLARNGSFSAYDIRNA